MGERREHLSKAHANEDFVDQVLGMAGRSGAYADWAATALFYAALHLVESRLADIEGLPDREKHPERHAESESGRGWRGRNRLVEDEMCQIYGSYRQLKDLSEWARYLVDSGITLPDVQDAREQHYEMIKAYCGA